ncbi:MAG: hypothetical protein ABIP50_02310 [Candidatus Saccharimonadales bacterium]
MDVGSEICTPLLGHLVGYFTGHDTVVETPVVVSVRLEAELDEIDLIAGAANGTFTKDRSLSNARYRQAVEAAERNVLIEHLGGADGVVLHSGDRVTNVQVVDREGRRIEWRCQCCSLIGY